MLSTARSASPLRASCEPLQRVYGAGSAALVTVGFGALVTKHVSPRSLVVGNPAPVLRQVPDEERLENA